MSYVDFEKFSEDEFAAMMQRRVFWLSSASFWAKVFIALWLVAATIMALCAGGVVVLSANALCAGVTALVAIPAIIALDFHKFKRQWE